MSVFFLGISSVVAAYVTLLFHAQLIGTSGGIGAFFILFISFGSLTTCFILTLCALIITVSSYKNCKHREDKIYTAIGITLAVLALSAAFLIFLPSATPYIYKLKKTSASYESYENQLLASDQRLIRNRKRLEKHLFGRTAVPKPEFKGAEGLSNFKKSLRSKITKREIVSLARKHMHPYSYKLLNWPDADMKGSDN